MSPRTKEQFEQIRQDKIALIRRTAMNEFVHGGFHATSISSIAKKAGISKGLIYNYFESKESLITEIFRHGMKKLEDLMSPAADQPIHQEEFLAMLQENMRMVQANRDFWQLYFSIFVQPDVMEIVRPVFTRYYDQFIDVLSNYFEQAGYEDPLAEAMILIALLDGVAMHFILNPMLFPLDKITDRLINYYRNSPQPIRKQ